MPGAACGQADTRTNFLQSPLRISAPTPAPAPASPACPQSTAALAGALCSCRVSEYRPASLVAAGIPVVPVGRSTPVDCSPGAVHILPSLLRQLLPLDQPAVPRSKRAGGPSRSHGDIAM